MPSARTNGTKQCPRCRRNVPSTALVRVQGDGGVLRTLCENCEKGDGWKLAGGRAKEAKLPRVLPQPSVESFTPRGKEFLRRQCAFVRNGTGKYGNEWRLKKASRTIGAYIATNEILGDHGREEARDHLLLSAAKAGIPKARARQLIYEGIEYGIRFPKVVLSPKPFAEPGRGRAA